jgi:hypothetical protein
MNGMASFSGCAINKNRQLHAHGQRRSTDCGTQHQRDCLPRGSRRGHGRARVGSVVRRRPGVRQPAGRAGDRRGRARHLGRVHRQQHHRQLQPHRHHRITSRDVHPDQLPGAAITFAITSAPSQDLPRPPPGSPLVTTSGVLTSATQDETVLAEPPHDDNHCSERSLRSLRRIPPSPEGPDRGRERSTIWARGSINAAPTR